MEKLKGMEGAKESCEMWKISIESDGNFSDYCGLVESFLVNVHVEIRSNRILYRCRKTQKTNDTWKSQQNFYCGSFIISWKSDVKRLLISPIYKFHFSTVFLSFSLGRGKRIKNFALRNQTRHFNNGVKIVCGFICEREKENRGASVTSETELLPYWMKIFIFSCCWLV